MCLFRHMAGTTGMDARARREHAHAARCSQCGVALRDTTKVAAHVTAHPCGVGCVGVVTLRTTCKGCNNRGGAFWGCGLRCRRLRWWWRKGGEKKCGRGGVGAGRDAER